MSAHRKEKQGVVVSNKMDKSIVVKVSTLKKHPLYGKVMKRSRKFLAHDENNQAQIGDEVRIIETRPLSKRKCWALREIIAKQEAVA